MAFVVSCVQNKGGCGKTTLGVSLYAAAVSGGDSVGIADLDPQGNASAWCLGRKAFRSVPRGAGAELLCAPGGAVSAARFQENHPAGGAQNSDESGDETSARFQKNHPVTLPEGLAVPCTRIPGGFVIPASPYMDRGRMHAVYLDGVPFDTLILDTPPQMSSTLFRSIVSQSDALIVPVQPEPFCVQNIVELVAEIENAGGSHLMETGRVRLVFNMVQKSVTHASWQALVSAQWGDMLSPVTIARAMAWADMSNHANKWNPKSKPAKTASELWADIITTTGRRAAA